MRFCSTIALLIAATLCLGCIHFISTTVNGSVIDVQKARAFSDAYLDDVMRDRQDAMYAKMESEFRQITPQDKFTELVRGLDAQFGKITKYEFVRDEVGGKLLYNGKTKPVRLMRYQVATTKGTYPLTVSVVPADNDLAVTDFTFTIASK